MKIVIASNNPGKHRELKALLCPLSIDLILQSDFSITSIPETGLTFIENAIQKARHASDISNLPALADDSGLIVDALSGEPGLHSARYAGENSTDEKNREKLLKALIDVPEQNRRARFYCTLVLLNHAKDPAPIICQGTWEGSILFEARGENGFGYDPIFYVSTHHCSAAELPFDIKNKISHRGQALQKLVQKLEVFS